MSQKISAVLMKWLAIVAALSVGAFGFVAVAVKAQTASTNVSKKKSRVAAKRRQRPRRASVSAPAATSQDPAANTGTGEPKATQVGADLNNKGEVGAQAEDPTRGSNSNQAGGSNKSDPKSTPTPAPTPQPRKP